MSGAMVETTHDSGKGEKKKFSSIKRTAADQAAANKERQTRIENTLDTVLNDLVQKGHLNPGKSYMFKTREMREHIGKMVDRVDRRKKGLPEHDPPSAPQKYNPVLFTDSLSSIPTNANAYPEPLPPYEISSISTNDTSRKNSKGSKNKVQQNSRRSSIADRKGRGEHGGGPRNYSYVSSKIDSGKISKKTEHIDPATLTLEPIDQVLMKSPVPFYHGRLDQMSEMFDPQSDQGFGAKADVQAYRASVDLRGFADDHISVELDGRRLIIVAQRPQVEKLKVNARKVIEIIDIPQGINLSNLKIGRGSDGSVLVEEFASPD